MEKKQIYAMQNDFIYDSYHSEYCKWFSCVYPTSYYMQFHYEIAHLNRIERNTCSNAANLSPLCIAVFISMFQLR